MSNVDMRAALSGWVAGRLASDRARIVRCADGVVRDPAWELDNSDSAFESAARIRVLLAVTLMLESTMSVDAIRAHATKEALGGARFPRRSTSITSNLMHQLQTAAWAEVAEWLGGQS